MYLRNLAVVAVFSLVLTVCAVAQSVTSDVVGSNAPSGAQGGAHVGEIVVEGNEHVSRDRILLGFGFRLGEEPSTESIREGVRRLYAMGHFSDVQVYVEPSGDGSLRMILVVEERPRVSAVDIRGNDAINSDDIEAVLRLESGVPFDVSRLEDTRIAVLALYESKGFPSATVDARTEDISGNSVRIVLKIDEGTRVLVRRVKFAGTEVISEKELKDVMKTREDRWWRTDAFFDEMVLDEDLVRIAERFRMEGYIDAAVVGYETEYEDEGERVTITITVDEGELYDITSVEWIGASSFALDALHDLTTVEPGDVYSPEEVERTIRDAYSWYGERGYIHARVYKQERVASGHELALVFNVDEGEPARIGRIHIAGNTRTKEKIIMRELSVRPGDLYQTSEVISSQRKIANLGFFNGPMVEFTDSADPENIDLVFTVEERQTGRAGVGVSHTSERGITGFLELAEANLFGNGQYLDFKWEFGKKNTELVLGFTEPWFMNRRLSVGFDLYDTDDKRTYGLLPDDFYEDAFPDTTDSGIWSIGEDESR
ncbi:outer membrane protein assembly factor BamA [bacterium]|nr:outer membrane protein assembly factor BamA [bacterium]